MKLRQAILLVQMLILTTIVALTVAITPAYATGNQSNQEMNQPAMLIAPDPEFQINVYPKPDTRKRRIGYGLGGDSVTVIEQVGSNEGHFWNYVKFDKSPQLEGWIREDFIAVQETAEQHDFGQKSSRLTQNDNWNQRQTNDRQNQHYRDTPQTGNWTNRYTSENQRQNNYNQRQN